MKLESNPKSNI